jgi:hypothetical protein
MTPTELLASAAQRLADAQEHKQRWIGQHKKVENNQYKWESNLRSAECTQRILARKKNELFAAMDPQARGVVAGTQAEEFTKILAAETKTWEYHGLCWQKIRQQKQAHKRSRQRLDYWITQECERYTAWQSAWTAAAAQQDTKETP